MDRFFVHLHMQTTPTFKRKKKNLASVMNSGLTHPEQVMKHKLHKEKEKEIYEYVVSYGSIWQPKYR